MNKIIKKAWGKEEIVVNNRKANYCLKYLFIDSGWQISYHYHPVKDETFVILKGLTVLDINGKERMFSPQQKLNLPPKTWHSVTALEDSVIMEISTFDRASDTVRMKGRESKFVGWRVCKHPEKCTIDL